MSPFALNPHIMSWASNETCLVQACRPLRNLRLALDRPFSESGSCHSGVTRSMHTVDTASGEGTGVTSNRKISLRRGWVKYGLQAHAWFCKYRVLLEHSHARLLTYVCNCFHATKAELSGCYRDHRLKRLLCDPLQKKFTDRCTRWHISHPKVSWQTPNHR